MSHQSEIEKKKYRNWVRGCLAFKYLTHGIENFADEVSKREHNRILQDVSKSGDTCDNCEFKNLKPLHSKVQDCNGKYKCPLDQKNCNCMFEKKKRCPKNICDKILEDILKTHGSAPPSPNWRNTNIRKWCSSPWEVTKCFINSPGYLDKESVSDIDSAGLLHVFVNNINFQQHIATKIDGQDAFTKTLKRRNDIFHSSRMELEENKLNECIADIISILEDEKELKGNQNSKQAVEKLHALKQETFIITTHDEVEVCRDAMNFVNNKLEELKAKIQDAKSEIDNKQTEAISAIQEETVIAVQKLEESREPLAERSLDERVKTLEMRVLNLEGRVENLEDIQDKYKAKLDFVERKREFQKNLVKLYQKHYVKTWISPFQTKDNVVSIKSVYVSPNIVEEADKCKGTSVTKDINDYKDIFEMGSNTAKKIYITGDVGTGKSSFCKMMIYNWCRIIKGCGDETENAMELKLFTFLFYIQIKCVQNRETHDLTDMIKELYKHETSVEVIEHILQYEGDHCLIIIDGLDEWIIPQQPCALPHVTYGIPVGDGIKDANFITLSRPSAEGILNMQTSEYDRKLTLLGIKENKLDIFTHKYMTILNQDSVKINKFKVKMRQSSFKHFKETPLLLQQMICIFCKSGVISKSSVDIYCNVINIALSWNKQKERTHKPSVTLYNRSDEFADIPLPISFEKIPRIAENKRLIFLLGKIAFKGIVQNKFSNVLSISNCGLNSNDLDSLKKLGFLVENNAIDNMYEDTFLSFIHLSYLEFFAAVYITSMTNKDNSILKELFLTFRTATEVLELSNIFLIICELSASMLENISQSIAENMREDENLACYRIKLHQSANVNYSPTMNLQNLLYRCFLNCENDFQGVLYLCDVTINDRTKIDFLYKINHGSVISLSLGKGTFIIKSRDIEKLFKWMSKLLNLESMRLSVGMVNRPIELYNFLNNKEKLRHLSLEYCNFGVDMKFDEYQFHIAHLLTTLQNIELLRVNSIETIKIFGPEALIESHEVCTNLSSSLIHAVSLKHLTLRGIGCNQCETHVVDLSQHRNLEYVDVEYFLFIAMSEHVTKETPSKATSGLTKSSSANCKGNKIVASQHLMLENIFTIYPRENHTVLSTTRWWRYILDLTKLYRFESVQIIARSLTKAFNEIMEYLQSVDISGRTGILYFLSLNHDTHDLTKLNHIESIRIIKCSVTLTSQKIRESLQSIEIYGVTGASDFQSLNHDMYDKLAIALGNCVSIKKIVLVNVKCNRACGGHFLDLTKLNQIETIQMIKCSLTLASQEIKENLESVEILGGTGASDFMSLDHDSYDKLAAALGNCVSIKKIVLENVTCSGTCGGHALDLTKLNHIKSILMIKCSLILACREINESLQSVEISGWSGASDFLSLDHDSYDKLAAALGNCVSVKRIDLKNVKCSSDCTDHIIDLTNDCTDHITESMLERINKTLQSIHLLSSTDYSDSMSLAHDLYDKIIAGLEKFVSVKRIDLENVKCSSDCTDHTIDLTKLNQIESVQMIGCSLSITSERMNTSLKSICLSGKQTFTNELNSAINSLKSLEKLSLIVYLFEKDALIITSGMKSLHLITLSNVVMSQSTWLTFMNSICSLEQSVKVKVGFELHPKQHSIIFYALCIINVKQFWEWNENLRKQNRVTSEIWRFDRYRFSTIKTSHKHDTHHGEEKILYSRR